MRKLLLAAGVAALAIAAPAAADKGGKGAGPQGGQAAKVEHGGGKGAARAAKVERRGGGDKVRARAPERRQARTARAPEQRQARVKHSPDRREVRSAGKVEHARPVRVARDDRGPDRVRDGNGDRNRIVRLDRRDDRRDGNRLVQSQRPDDRRFDRDGDRRDRFPLRFASRDYGWSDNGACPPGLAKKHNGCLPPGQAKKLVGRAIPAAFATSLLPSYYRSWYPDNDRYTYRTGDDFIYRIARGSGLVDGYMPLFDYADYSPDYYYAGERYPLEYVNFYNVPVAYQPYYEDQGDWLYRYGDGAIYQVNRSSGLVNAIVQLLAGDLAVGSPLPMGYDAYNVPYAYRGRYYDTPDHWYRYNDGYIYQVDPKTRLIQAVIQALV